MKKTHKILIICTISIFLQNCQEKRTQTQTNKITTSDTVKKDNIYEKTSPKFESAHIITPDLSFGIYREKKYTHLKNPYTKSDKAFRALLDTTKNVEERKENMYIEKYSLSKDKLFAKRNGEELILNLKNGQKKILTSNKSMSDTYCTYYYREYLKEIGYYVCVANLYEGEICFLINDFDGERFLLSGVPKLSPDEKLLVTTAYGLPISPYNHKNINVWSIQNKKIILLLSYEIDGFFWNFEWESDTVLICEVLGLNTTVKCYDEKYRDYNDSCKSFYRIQIIR